MPTFIRGRIVYPPMRGTCAGIFCNVFCHDALATAVCTPVTSRVAPIDDTLKTCMMVSMEGYKRNQVEEALSRLLEPKTRDPSTELRSRVKRLLETDREMGRSPRSSEPEKSSYAFYSADAPGSGVEV